MASSTGIIILLIFIALVIAVVAIWYTLYVKPRSDLDSVVGA